MATSDQYITGKVDYTKYRPEISDIWGGDYVYEYPDFLSQDHVSDVLARVRSDWHLTFSGDPPAWQDDSECRIRCLGQNFWSLPSDHTFDDVFDLNLRQFMSERYSDINHLVEDFCINYLDRIPEYVPGVATPGFNLVINSIPVTSWHTDGALIRKLPDIDVKKIISLTIPIQCDDQSHTQFMLNPTDTYDFKFRPGHLLIWPGRKSHRFGCQTISDDYYRITYQCHIYDAGDRALIYF